MFGYNAAEVIGLSVDVIDLLHRAPTRDDRARPVHHLAVPLAGPPGWPEELSVRVRNHWCSRLKPAPPGLSGLSFGPAMYPSRDIEM